MLLSFLVVAAVLLILGLRIAASPPFVLLGSLFSIWADRCRDETPGRHG